MRRLRVLVRKELQELARSPRLLALLVVAPVIQLALLGYAATTDVRDVPLAIADGDRSPASRELIARFEASPYFTVAADAATAAGAAPLLERGAAWLVLDIPAGYGRLRRQGQPAVVQVVADGSDANSAGVALGYATALVGAYALEGAGPAPGGIDPRIRIWYNPKLESRDFMIPGVLALILLVVTTNLAAMAIVREKEVGTLEQLNVSPLRRWELIVGKLLPYGAIGMIDVLLVVAVAVSWFEVPLRGSLALLAALSLLYVMCTLSLGLLVSTISATQQQAMMTATFFFLTPMIYLSGFVFPIENMPAAIRWLTYVIPLRYFLVIVRGIFLKGAGLAVLWPQAAALAAWGSVVLLLAVARSRKRAG